MADGIDSLPVVEPTPEERSAYESQFGPPPLNPIRDLSAAELADLASADKENFELVSAFRQNQELWKNPEIVTKVADAHNIIKQRGFSLKDLPSAPKAVGLAWDVAKGFGKQAWNYAQALVGTPIAGVVGAITGQPPSFSEELTQLGQRQVAENIAGTEQAITGLAEMGERAIGKIGRAVGIAKPLQSFTPEEKVQDLWKSVGVGEAQEDISRGKGGFLTPVGGAVVQELQAAGKPVRPEEVGATAAGDPFSFWTFGKGFGLAGKAIPAPVRAAGARAEQIAGEAAEKVAGAGVRTVGKISELGGKAAEVAGKVGPAVAATKALVMGEPISALATLGAGRIIGGVSKGIGKRVSEGGKAAVEVGRQVGGKPVISPIAQGFKDIAFATPGALGEIATGTAADIGLAAVSAETPQQTEGAVGIGTVFGAVGAARRVGGRIVSGQLIAPREYGVSTPVPSSGQFPRFEAMNDSAFKTAPPGVRARLNAVREFSKSAGLETDVFLAPDAAALESALIDSGISPDTAKQFSQQEGFFTTALPGADGKPRRVIIAKNIEATPHEAFHGFQDVLGEAGNQQLDGIVRQEYSPRWDAEGERYARRLVGDLGGRSWEEVVLDQSGWGLDAAKEKIFREIYNRLEGETGATPTPDVVRELADPEIVRIFNEAQTRNPGADPSQFWREVLSPEEAKATADRYIARELAAENFDAVFKNLGGALTPGNTLPQRLARVVANTISTLGGEPLAGRRTEIGRIEPRFAVTEKVRGLARGEIQKRGVTTALPTPTTKFPARGLPSTPETQQIAADEARVLAEQAPEQPVAGGTKSPRELLGAIAEAIAQRAGVKINYLSAPDQPAAATTSNRTARREIIETFRTMPAAARALWEKSFFPERVLKTKSGYQVMGWAPEVFAANAHKLAKTLSEIPGGERLTPYQLDATRATFTDAAWQELFADTQQFVENQIAGQTGAGQPLVVPKSLAERGFTAPAIAGRGAKLEQSRADVINMLFNFRLPETPRIQPGKLPLNIAGQEVSIATAGGPQRLSVPVQPRQPFAGESAAALGIEGRAILETNPARATIEQAAAQAKVAMPEFIEAIQRLNLENIKEVAVALELPQFRGNTLTLTAGFQPSADPRAVKAAAVRDREGKIFEGVWHGEAEDIAIASGSKTPAAEFDTGFVTNSGEWLDRNQAFKRAQELQQIAPRDLKEFTTVVGPQLESSTFQAVKQFQPVADQARQLIDFTPEQWKATVGSYKGKLGAGLTGWAWDLGASAKTPADVLALREAAAQLNEVARSISLNDPEGFNRKMEVIGRAQAAREAFEAATGSNLEGTNEGSAVPGIRKFVDPNYKPPVPLRQPAQRSVANPEIQAQPIKPDESIRNLAEEYSKSSGIRYVPDPEVIPVNESLAKQIADLYEDLSHDPENPEVRATYDALANETVAQYRAITDAGYTVEPWRGANEPYRSSAEMIADVRDRKHLYFLPTQTAFEGGALATSANLMLRPSEIPGLSVNDVFRAVHDFFGHAKEGHQFGPKGELNAWKTHSEMFSDAAQGALAAETLAQNSWVNFGRHLRNPQGNIPAKGAEGYRALADRPFAEQKNVVIPDEIIQQVLGKTQAQPSAEPELKLRKPKGGFSKAWILPTGQPVQLGGQWHHEWLDANPEIRERYGIPESTQDAGSRMEALRKGFARINYSQNGGRLVIEARSADWPKLRASVEDFIDANLDQIDNLRIELFDPEVTRVVNSGSSRFMDKASDLERMQDIPFITREETGSELGSAQFQPRPEDDAPPLPGFTASREVLSTKQLSEMSRKDLQNHFPEAVIPTRLEDSIPSDVANAPLVKQFDLPAADAYAEKLVEFAREKESTPEFQLGRRWYSEFSTQLKAQFGKDARIFAELLAATSPRTPVETNFKFALDALEGFQSGRFKSQIRKFEQGLGLIANNRWKSWYNRELRAGKIPNPPAEPTPATFIEHWIETHDIKPRQSNGKLYGMNSIPVLQVAARRWLEQVKGPKVRNFVENLLGEGHEATIDIWANRTMRRLGYSDFQERWRILPQHDRSVSDADFALSQAAFRKAAEQLGLKPSELQAALWFSEKQLWAENGWARLDLGDFRTELKKTEALRKEIQSRGRKTESTPELIFAQPRSKLKP